MPATQHRPSQVSPRTVWTVGLNALLLVVVVLVLHDSRTVISWMLVALLLALAIHPAVRWLTRKGLRRGLAVLAVFLVLGGLVALLVASFVPMLVEQGKALVNAAPDLLERIEESRAMKWADKRFDVMDRIQTELRENAAQAAAPALSVATGAARGLAATVTIVALTVFFLLFGEEVFRKALEWVRPEERERYVHLAVQMHRSVGGYVAGSFLVATVGGVVTAVTLLVLGVPYFLPLGLVMVVLGLIPFIGSALGAVVVVGTAFASSGVKAGVITAVVYLVYQQVENELLQPLIQRRTLKMNPLIITMVMLLGTSLAGVLGALLALPVAGALQVFLQDALARRQSRWIGGPGSFVPQPPVATDGRESQGAVSEPPAPH
ncbi:AI-2E family transporter [Hyalangium gracile]|uniref:AI-2E family transporter n=1 Tax=Hyalangium gracile TaxID=394092 RepID=UPI001CCDC520|nr:AI-2E family transporter [Hyalangium gracile]